MAQQAKIVLQFPRLSARIAAVVDSDYAAAPDKSFEFGLEVIFDGLEGQLAQGQP